MISVKFAFQGLDKFPEEETGTYVAKVGNSDKKCRSKFSVNKIESRCSKSPKVNLLWAKI